MKEVLSRSRGFLLGLSASALLLAHAASAAAGDPVTTVTLRAPAGQPLRDVPVTFGQVFRKGDIRQGVLVTAGRGLVQADVKRRYDDGSIRFAVISLWLPEMDGAMTVSVSDGAGRQTAARQPVQAADLLATDFDATVTLKFPGGAERSASARELLRAAGPEAKTWLAGPVATEWLLNGTLREPNGTADPDLRVQFHVRAYAGCQAIRVSVVVENCLDTWAGNIGYDVAIRLGKQSQMVYEKREVHHRRLSRWRKDFWWPAVPAQADAVPELAYLCASGALPNYDRSIVIPEQTLDALAARWSQNSETDILGSGSLTKYMPTTGGRPEIGPYPNWTVQYLLSMDPRVKAIVLGNGELAGSWPIHVRNARTGRILTLDQRPKFWLNGYRDGDRERPLWQPDRTPPPPQRTPDGKQHPYYLTPDVAHMGSYAYVPYLLTGDFYYLEEAYLWGNYALLAQWPVPRQDGRGIMSDQIRGNAWGLRNIADAAFVAPDGDPEAGYFAEKIRNNLAELTAKMLGPPEYNAMGFWGVRTVEDARIQNPANPRWLITAPWEHDFLIWSLHHLTELGFTEAAAPRDFELRWRVGVFTHPDEFNPLLGAPYRMAVGELGPDQKPLFYENWKKLGEENAKLTKLPDSPKPRLAYDYSAYLALVCGVDAGFPQAADALQTLLVLSGGFHELLADPAWRIVPRTPARRAHNRLGHTLPTAAPNIELNHKSRRTSRSWSASRPGTNSGESSSLSSASSSSYSRSGPKNRHPSVTLALRVRHDDSTPADLGQAPGIASKGQCRPSGPIRARAVGAARTSPRRRTAISLARRRVA